MIETPPTRFSDCRPNRRIAQNARQAICLALLIVLQIAAQNARGQQHAPGLQPLSPRATNAMDDTSGPENIDEEKALRALNAERQRSMVADTARLVRLVNELNAEIERMNPDSLTPAQLHKVAEIEKLARNVKDKMSTSVRGLQVFPPPHFPQR